MTGSRQWWVTVAALLMALAGCDPSTGADGQTVDLQASLVVTPETLDGGSVAVRAVGGGALAVTTAVDNAGTAEAEAVSVTVDLPAELEWDGAAPEGWSCRANEALSCGLGGPLAAGSQAVLPLTATTVGEVSGELAVTVTVSHDGASGTGDRVGDDSVTLRPRGGDVLDDEVVEQLGAAVKDAADERTGGTVAWIDTPTERLVFAEGPAHEGGTPLRGDQAFRVASITKLFTATAALQLAEEGAVDLDAPVARVLPERAARFERGDEVTLRQLLSHSAGLPENVDPGAFDEEVLDVVDIEAGVASIACDDVERLDLLDYTDREAVFEPGVRGGYSNIGYLLAGEIIEAVAGQPLEQVYRERILDPLGMTGTWLDCPEEPRAELAPGIHPPGADDMPGQGEEPFDVTELNRWSAASGGMVSTPEDLTVFARALLGGELFDDDATLEAMLEPGPLAGPHGAYGLGVWINDDTIDHDGHLRGYRSFLRYYPVTDTVVVVWSNAIPHPPAYSGADAALMAIHDLLLDALE